MAAFQGCLQGRAPLYSPSAISLLATVLAPKAGFVIPDNTCMAFLKKKYTFVQLVNEFTHFYNVNFCLTVYANEINDDHCTIQISGNIRYMV